MTQYDTIPSKSAELTDERVQRVYDELGLNDPKVREFYDNLRRMRAEVEPQIWLRTSHHSAAPQ